MVMPCSDQFDPSTYYLYRKTTYIERADLGKCVPRDPTVFNSAVARSTVPLDSNKLVFYNMSSGRGSENLKPWS